MADGMIRGFYQYSRAWCATPKDESSDEVMFGMYDKEGYTDGEIAIRWHEVGDRLAPQLEAFDDGWANLWEFRDVLEKMAQYNDRGISPEEFCNLLESCGFKDLTPTDRDADSLALAMS